MSSWFSCRSRRVPVAKSFASTRNRSGGWSGSSLWGLFRTRLAAIRRPIATFSEGARDLGTLIDDVRAVMIESDSLSPGRVALIELAWQRMHTIHDAELAGVRLTDALRPGPDIIHAG